MAQAFSDPFTTDPAGHWYQLTTPGFTWDEGTGSYGSAAGAVEFYYGACDSVTQYVMARISPTVAYGGLVLRGTKTSTCYLVQFISTTLYFQRFDSSGWIEDYGSLTPTFAANDVWGFTIEGTGGATRFRGWRNPTGLPSAVDNWNGDTSPEVDTTITALGYAGSTYCNTGMYTGLGDEQGAIAYDNFFGGDVPVGGGGGGGSAKPMLHGVELGMRQGFGRGSRH